MHRSRRYRHLLLLLSLLSLASPAGAQALFGEFGARQLPYGAQTRKAIIAIVPDPQNYCTTDDAHLYNHKLAMEQLDAQVSDIIALHPDFVIVVGDLTDTTGGADQGIDGTGMNGDDPNSATATNDKEWRCFRERVWTPLRNAGIQVFLVTGNHDSCVDFERWFPAAEWSALPYAYSVENSFDDCGPGENTNTEQRTALMETAIGDICVVGADYARINFTNGIGAYVNANVGCGVGAPTIIARHSISADPTWMDPAGNSEIFLTTEGHFVGDPPMFTMSGLGPYITDGDFEVAFAYINMQEVHMGGNGYGCPALGVAVPDGSCMHTGLSWYGVLEIEPSVNKLRFQARNPWMGGRATSHIPALYMMDPNSEISFTIPWCTRFPGGPAC